MTVFITRAAASFHLDSGRVNVVRDITAMSAPIKVNGTVQQMAFEPAPFGSISNFSSASGARADRLTMQMDGAHLKATNEDGEEGDPNLVLQSIFEEPMRNRRVDIYRFYLHPDTMEVAEAKHKWVGRVDNVTLNNKDPRRPMVKIDLLSYRVHAAKPDKIMLSDVAQRALYPDDGGLKMIEDTVFRAGEFRWNQENSGSGRTWGGGGGGNNYNPRYQQQR